MFSFPPSRSLQFSGGDTAINTGSSRRRRRHYGIAGGSDDSVVAAGIAEAVTAEALAWSVHFMLGQVSPVPFLCHLVFARIP